MITLRIIKEITPLCDIKNSNRALLSTFIQAIIIMGDNKLVITTGPKTSHFDLPKDSGINLKHGSIIKHNKLLAEHAIKSEIRQLLVKYKHGNDIH